MSPGGSAALLPFRSLALGNAVTKNMSKGGFLCACPAWIQKDDTVQVFFADEPERHLGDAHLVRVVEADVLYSDCGFQFVEPIAGMEKYQ
jgi:hypothetical protein